MYTLGNGRHGQIKRLPLPSLFTNSVRLKNIEETEKAKRRVAEERQARHGSRQHQNDDFASARCASEFLLLLIFAVYFFRHQLIFSLLLSYSLSPAPK